MTGRRKWAAIPGLVLVAAFAAALSAWSGARRGEAAQTSAAPVTEQAPPGAPQPTAQPSNTGAPQGAPAPNTVAPAATGAVEGSTHTVYTATPDTNPSHGPWGYSAASSDQNYSPVQPIRFPHPSHVQKAGMNCVYCHFAANKSPDPGMPAVGTCMGCHALIKAKNSPEIKKLEKYWNVANPAQSKPIPWIRIHKVPDYVNFPHMRHVSAGVTCQTCHGEVQKMNQVFQYSSLNMGWCINCHIQRKARYDCAVCHY